MKRRATLLLCASVVLAGGDARADAAPDAKDAQYPPIRRLPPEKLRALGPMLHGFDLVLVETDADARLRQVTSATLIAAAPEAVREVVAHPERYTAFVRNLDKSDVVPLDGGALEQTYAFSYGLFSLRGRNRFVILPPTAELPAGAVEIYQMDANDHFRWEFFPADTGGGTIAVLYSYNNFVAGTDLTGRAVAQHKSLAWGLAVTVNLTMLLSMKAPAEAQPGVFPPYAPPPPGSPATKQDFLLDRGTLALVRGTKDRLDSISVVERAPVPIAAVLGAAAHPGDWSKTIPSVTESGEGQSEHGIPEARLKRTLPLTSWETRYAIRPREGGVGLYAVGGDLQGSQLQLDARPDRDGARVTLRTDEHYGRSSVVFRGIFRREPLFEHGVNVGMGMVLLRGVIAKARAASAAPR